MSECISMGKIGQNGITKKENKMNPIKQNVISEVVEKLDASNSLEIPEPFFGIGKNVIPSCPVETDMRDFIDPLIESMFFDKGYGYAKGLSSANQLVFARLSKEQKVQWMAQRITVRVTTYTTCMVEGEEEVEEELRKMYNVQSSKEWLPACCGSFEMGLCVTIGGFFLKYFNDIVLPGLAWDASKSVFSALWKALEKLSNRTEEFDIRCMEFMFDDITIKVGDVMANNYGSIMRLFLKIHENVQYLQSKGLEGINKISVPFIPSEFDKEKFEYAAPMDNYDNCWWKVSYLHGCNKLFFNPETKEMR